MATPDKPVTNFPTPLNSTCNLLLGDATGYAVLASCTSTPPTTANYFQHGCLMYQTDTSTGSAAVYQNLGSIAVPAWSLLESAGAGFSLPAAATDASTTTTTSFSLTTSGITTGIGESITANSLTTGSALAIASSAAGTGTRSLVKVTNSAAAAVNATPIEVVNSSSGSALKTTVLATSTNYFKVFTANGVTLWVGNGTTANGNLSGTAGDLLLNGASSKLEYCTGTNVWVPITSA